MSETAELRNDWKLEEVETLFDLPFNDLIFQAQTIHRMTFDPNKVQVSTLMSIKTGGCSEDCSYCSQSARNSTDLEREKLAEVSAVLEAAREAKRSGSSRFCMGAAWRNPKSKDMERLLTMVSGVKALGMETCMTLGMLTDHQAQKLKKAGLDYYNHNLDTSEAYYGEVVTTRTYQDRLDTLEHVRDAGLNICSGGIVGMGESRQDRAGLLATLANLPKQPDSVPINRLVKVAGTPLDDMESLEELDPLEFVRTIAVARILMPKSWVRLSAGRESMSEELQALCFASGANSIFSGEQLLTTPNAGEESDASLFAKLGLEALAGEEVVLG
ncbi:MAG: biotin synthase BioB [Gammaproteobacteria bacterium]|jgi:biotin synthase|nr:biotin synthase BioB [Gammaproteobacteria bacterium]MBT4608027.1 biotin synthase BioB [Thiotrichales bacterium]MBT3471945.1 biotin synthase BioB [Gammaproteobacteria bacterium]MBT3966382.1 biotin synthase BioB [Gammaproteobacteria bacterium]MBT4080392.1 biotin synthase BioB [Gammaproteobacteria bacterium]